jgi:hypothetical protein
MLEEHPLVYAVVDSLVQLEMQMKNLWKTMVRPERLV